MLAMSFNVNLPTLPTHKRSRSGEYQVLPVTTSARLSTSSPILNSTRPRYIRRRINVGIIALTACILILIGWHRPTRDCVGGYAKHGKEAATSWLDEQQYGLKSKYWVERMDEWKGHCRDWDPDNSEEEDPESCLKARQYRQTMRVLEREEKATHVHWDFTLEHNRATFRNISKCFLPTWHGEYKRCLDKPLIISGWWSTAEVLLGKTTDEVIWQSSVVKQLELLGMSYVAVGPYENWIEVAELMPDVYRFIWMSDIDAVSCSTDPRCVAKEHYVPPDGADDLSIGIPDNERGTIKLWQMLVVDYWGARPDSVSDSWWYWGPNTKDGWSYQPLGEEWIATPWALPGKQFHLAYSIEDVCMSLPVIPQDQRDMTVLLLADRSSYFTLPGVTPPELLSALSKDPLFDLVLPAEIEEGHPLPDVLITLGKQSRGAYSELLSESKVLLGIGQPMLSSSVYTALCQAVPVVLPYTKNKPRLDGWHLFGDSHQHGPASLIGLPYVYSYYESNYSSLADAVHQALTTPIERYIPANMTSKYALSKTREYINRDLETMFKNVIKSNKGQIPGMAAGIRERCFELERCREMIKPGTVKKNKLKSGGVVRTGIDQ